MIGAETAATRGGSRATRSKQAEPLSLAIRRCRQLEAHALEREAAWEVAKNAFQHISGICPQDPTPEDCERLRLLDAVIAQVHASERAMFTAHGREGPDGQRRHHDEMWRRMRTNPAEPEAPRSDSADVLRRIAAGAPARITLDINRLTPAGLLALGQIVHFEHDVQVREATGADSGAEAGPGAMQALPG